MKRTMSIISIACLMTISSPILSNAVIENFQVEEVKDSIKTEETLLGNKVAKVGEIKESFLKSIVGNINLNDLSKLGYVKLDISSPDGKLTDNTIIGSTITPETTFQGKYGLIAEFKDGTKKLYFGVDKDKVKSIAVLNHEEFTESEGEKIPKYVAINLKKDEKEINLELKTNNTGEEKITANMKVDIPKSIYLGVKLSNPNNSVNPNEEQEKEEVKIYKVPVKLLKKNSNELAKGSDGIIGQAIIKEEKGKSEVFIETVGVEGKNSLGFILGIDHYQQGANNSTKADIVQTIRYTTNKKLSDGNYEVIIKPKVFRLLRDKIGETEIPVNLIADNKELFDPEARLVFDYANKKDATENDIPQKKEIDGGKKKIYEEPNNGGNTPKPTPTPTQKKPDPSKPTQKLPQTGSPINTMTMITGGIVSLLSGIFLYRKK